MGYEQFTQKSTRITRSTLGRYVVNIRTRVGHVPLRINNKRKEKEGVLHRDMHSVPFEPSRRRDQYLNGLRRDQYLNDTIRAGWSCSVCAVVRPQGKGYELVCAPKEKATSSYQVGAVDEKNAGKHMQYMS